MTDTDAATRAAQAWLANAQRRGLVVVTFSGEVYMFGPDSPAKYRDLLTTINLHKSALLQMLGNVTTGERYAMVRGKFADPGELEGHT